MGAKGELLQGELCRDDLIEEKNVENLLLNLLNALIDEVQKDSSQIAGSSS